MSNANEQSTSQSTSQSSFQSSFQSTSQSASNSKQKSIGICGLGCVGDAMFQHFLKNTNLTPVGYDKYKEPYDSDDLFQKMLNTDMVFLCLPTLYSPEIEQYDKSAIFEVCKRLNEGHYKGLVVLKSTVEPGTTDDLSKKYPAMDFAHNPEFLTARTSYEDFTNQPHIVIGRTRNCDPEKFQMLVEFYKQYWPKSEYSVCFSLESETMKSGCNGFYAFKIAYFNMLYKTIEKHCETSSISEIDAKKTFDKTLKMMLKNNWINPMHTNVPGPDGNFGFGGACFPKDINALSQHVKRMGVHNEALQGVVNLNLTLRDDVPY